MQFPLPKACHPYSLGLLGFCKFDQASAVKTKKKKRKLIGLFETNQDRIELETKANSYLHAGISSGLREVGQRVIHSNNCKERKTRDNEDLCIPGKIKIKQLVQHFLGHPFILTCHFCHVYSSSCSNRELLNRL